MSIEQIAFEGGLRNCRYEFFNEDFSKERARKTALKNAYVLMSKQRYMNSAAFFLLGNSLTDAIQVGVATGVDVRIVVCCRLY